MKYRASFLLLAILGIALLSLILFWNGGLQTISLIDPEGKEMVLSVEIADEEPEWRQGLMHREQVSSGMLFIYPEPQMLSFWMKNTLVPLDILFFGANGQIVSAAQMTPCQEDPCTTYPSGTPAMYALEMPAGFLEENGVMTGWRLVLR